MKINTMEELASIVVLAVLIFLYGFLLGSTKGANK
jgi:hypothetical protein